MIKKYSEFKLFEKRIKSKKLDTSVVESELNGLIDHELIETAEDIYYTEHVDQYSKLSIDIDYSNDDLSLWDENILIYCISNDEENGYNWYSLTRETLDKIKSKPDFVYFVTILYIDDKGEHIDKPKSKQIVERLKRATGYDKIFYEYDDYLKYLGE